MTNQHVAVRAVLTTLARATADARTPVVLRTRRPDQAQLLAGWLRRVHGSERTVIASARARGLIEVQLPARLDWPAIVHEEMMTPLAAAASAAHLSSMTSIPAPRGTR